MCVLKPIHFTLINQWQDLDCGKLLDPFPLYLFTYQIDRLANIAENFYSKKIDEIKDE